MSELIPVANGSVQIVGYIIAGLLTFKFIDSAWNYFFKRLTKDYITEQACGMCKQDRKNADTIRSEEFNLLKKEIREQLGVIRGILLVLVTKQEPSADQISDLTK